MNEICENEICEYESLRSEIVSQLETKRNIWIYMYVLYLTMFVLGIEVSRYFLLVTYIIIIPFQSAINSHARAIRIMSTYIRIFFEEQYSFINWETFCICKEYKDFRRTTYKGIRKVLHMGSVQLGGLSTIFFIYLLLKESCYQGIFKLKCFDILFIIISISLFVCVYLENKDYQKETDKDLETLVKSFHDSLNNKNTKI